jgi:hypothetical protein
MPKPRQLRTAADLAGAKVSLYLGGPARGYVYDEPEWKALARLVAAVAESYGVEWHVTNSRRTPAVASDLFTELAKERRLKEFIDFRSAGPGSAQHLLAADAIVVTEDSRSMMADAMAAMRPVLLMQPKSVVYGLGTERIAATVAGGGAAVLPIATATAAQFAAVLTAVQVPARQPRDIVTEVIATALGLPYRDDARLQTHPA